MAQNTPYKKNRKPSKLLSDNKPKLMYAGDNYINQAHVLIDADGVKISANVPKDKGADMGMEISKLTGVIVHGPLAVITNLANISIGPMCVFNKMLELFVPSTVYTPSSPLSPKPWPQLNMGGVFESLNKTLEGVAGSAVNSAVGSVGDAIGSVGSTAGAAVGAIKDLVSRKGSTTA